MCPPPGSPSPFRPPKFVVLHGGEEFSNGYKRSKSAYTLKGFRGGHCLWSFSMDIVDNGILGCGMSLEDSLMVEGQYKKQALMEGDSYGQIK